MLNYLLVFKREIATSDKYSLSQSADTKPLAKIRTASRSLDDEVSRLLSYLNLELFGLMVLLPLLLLPRAPNLK